MNTQQHKSIDDTHVGYLAVHKETNKHQAVCCSCGLKTKETVKLYKGNIQPYNQNCGRCNSVMVKSNDFFCQLFDNPAK